MKPPTTRTFVFVWLALMALALASFLLSYVQLGTWSAVIALGIGAVKALLIASFFMHLAQQPSISRWSFALGVALALLLFTMIGLDVLTRQAPGIQQPGLELPAQGYRPRPRNRRAVWGDYFLHTLSCVCRHLDHIVARV